MYIAPNSTIRLLTNVPLTPNYSDTIYFNNSSEQFNYFSRRTLTTLGAQSYVKAERQGVIRVEVPQAVAYKANYLMYQNTSYGDKWFYAFIDKVEYVNDGLTNITFTLDIMQTWFFDYNLQECLVEREHPASDRIGEHLVPESVGSGDRFITTASKAYLESNHDADPASFSYIYVLTAERFDEFRDNAPVSPAPWGGYPITCYCYIFDIDVGGMAILKKFVDKVTELGKIESIISMAMLPRDLAPNPNTGTVKTTDFEICGRVLPFVPKNNKLYTYPYCQCVIDAGGNSQTLKFEQWAGYPQTVENPPRILRIRSSFTGADNPVTATPVNYGGESEAIQYQVAMKGYPLLPWTKNYYADYIGKNAMTEGWKGLGSALGGMTTGALVAGPAGALIGATVALRGIAANLYKNHTIADAKPDTQEGQSNGAEVNFLAGWKDIISYCRTPPRDILHGIDDYFDKFGYATNRVKVPNRNVRPTHTYCKTVGCNVSGSAPSEDLRGICKIYDNGITFWRNGATVGDYSRNNKV